MKYFYGIGIVIVALLALYGGVQASRGARSLYDDWVFLRAARVQALQQAAQRQQQSSSVNTP